ncbi:putative MFS family arabinose efflux permease [Pseudonocardia sediminis]|uniref:Putative MFS family arabinose efflux permease n=1 Tax=Pseudonocardia sediminis TaxID=1397368 RepID=A0A4Q7UYG4_PSEST|nr:MFS transporter [Pseudonocardia sediminis]RZT86021.1 putative MFS family arabinose efflux permease [Pseudonocardia sediminis]
MPDRPPRPSASDPSPASGAVPDAAGVPDGVRRLRLLQVASLVSTCDRFAIAPLLVLIAADLDVSLGVTAGVAGGYFLAYGLMQAVWGVLSDRLGRVRVMRVALCGAAAAGLASALAPTVTVLLVARVVTGGCFAALIPASLVYVGDTWPEKVRQRPLSDVLAASALGTAVATAGAGLLADLVGWRTVFGLTAAAGAVLFVALRRLPEPTPSTGPAAASGLVGALRPLGTVLADGWARIVLLLAFVEGVVVLAALTFLAPALQSLGSSAGVAGLVSGGFGVGALVFSRLVRRLVGSVPPAGLAAVGGAFLVAAWAGPSVTVNLGTVLAAGIGLGGAWAFLHSTLQTWATQVVPQARASAVALFATVLFLGSAAGTALAAPLADAGEFGSVFRVALVVAVPLVVAAALARWRYGRTSRA